MSVGTALVQKSKAKIQWPWFILFFCLASVANTYVGVFQPAYSVLRHLGILGLTVTLFLIGTGISKRTIREVGVRPMLQGIPVMGGRCDRFAGADSCGVDFLVSANRRASVAHFGRFPLVIRGRPSCDQQRPGIRGGIHRDRLRAARAEDVDGDTRRGFLRRDGGDCRNPCGRLRYRPGIPGGAGHRIHSAEHPRAARVHVCARVGRTN